MGLMTLVEQVNDKVANVRGKLARTAPTLLRFDIGVVFVSTGWAHIHDLDGLTSNFVDWGIPMPHFNAVLSSATELVCGALILIGLFSRLAALPLIVTMIVAIISAKRDQFHDLTGVWDAVTTLANLIEFTYIAILVSIAVMGSGPISADFFIGKFWSRRHQVTSPQATKS